jgi:demethylmenaquinone methyltransferase/2-methoxy-6-polyprenyl-1,4-benzoquinol methylase
LNSLWFADSATVQTVLDEFNPSGRILELACGTGIWTEKLLPYASSMTCVDGSLEMLAINKNRVRSSRVDWVQANLFDWEPCGQFDQIFFGFWLSHVPPTKFESFWKSVSDSLSPGGRVFFVDSRHEHTSTASDHLLPKPEATTLRRRLNNGSEYQIYKVFYEPSDLVNRLRTLGWTFEVSQTAHYFIYGRGHRAT